MIFLPVPGAVQCGSFVIPKSALAASAAWRKGKLRSQNPAARSTDQGTMPLNVVSICIGTNGSDGCRHSDGTPVMHQFLIEITLAPSVSLTTYL